MNPHDELSTAIATAKKAIGNVILKAQALGADASIGNPARAAFRAMQDAERTNEELLLQWYARQDGDN